MTHVSLILQDRDISVSHAVTYISLTLAHQDLEALIAGHGLPSDIRTKLIQVFASGLGSRFRQPADARSELIQVPQVHTKRRPDPALYSQPPALSHAHPGIRGAHETLARRAAWR